MGSLRNHISTYPIYQLQKKIQLLQQYLIEESSDYENARHKISALAIPLGIRNPSLEARQVKIVALPAASITQADRDRNTCSPIINTKYKS